jgi:hypothetical protein
MKIYQKVLTDFEENYLGYIPLLMIGQSCIGSAAVMFILQNEKSVIQIIQLALVVFACMTTNVAVLSQQKPKFVFNFTIFTVLVSITLISVNTLI